MKPAAPFANKISVCFANAALASAALASAALASAALASAAAPATTPGDVWVYVNPKSGGAVDAKYRSSTPIIQQQR